MHVNIKTSHCVHNNESKYVPMRNGDVNDYSGHRCNCDNAPPPLSKHVSEDVSEDVPRCTRPRHVWMALCECFHVYMTLFMCLPRSKYRVGHTGETASADIACTTNRFHVLLGRQSRIDRRCFVRAMLQRLRREHHLQRLYTETELKEQRCSICLKDFKRRRNACCLPCGHLYHQRCIVNWFARDIHMTCPICRADFVAGSQATKFVGSKKDCTCSSFVQ